MYYALVFAHFLISLSSSNQYYFVLLISLHTIKEVVWGFGNEKVYVSKNINTISYYI